MGELSLHPVGPDDMNDIIEMITCTESHAIELTCDQRDDSVSSDTINQSRSTATNVDRPSIRQEYETTAVKAILDEIYSNPLSEYKGFTIRCGNSSKDASMNVMVGFVFTR